MFNLGYFICIPLNIEFGNYFKFVNDIMST